MVDDSAPEDRASGRLDISRPSVDEDGVTIGGAPIVAGERLDAGASLGRYRILEPLGQGAMGIVYAAYDPRLDRRVALKVLHNEVEGDADDSAGRERLVREAQALAKLSHPNVVTVHDAGVVGGRVFVAMELIAGITLREWATQTEREPLVLLEQLLRAGRGLAAAHAAGLVHRDFKPENVIVGDDGRVRVVDFGLARQTGELQPAPDLETDDGAIDQLTRTGVLLGTPGYMAPEQFLGGMIDARTDQFAFCVTTWELMHRRRPFAGQGAAALGYQITRAEPQDPPADSAAPPWLDRLLRRGIAKAAEDRHPSLAALLDAIELQLHPPRRRRSMWPLAALGTAAIAATTAGFMWLGADDEPPCGHGAARMAQSWDAPQRRAITTAFAATGSPIAVDSTDRVTASLDAWAQRWMKGYTDACEATHVRHEQSEAALDLRMRCLERQRQQLGVFVELLGEADAALVQQAVAASEKLGDLARCDDVAQLEQTTALPVDAAQAATVEALELRLVRARAQAQAGRWAEAKAAAVAIVDEAAAIPYRPLEAEAAYVAAGTHHALKEPDLARAAALRSVSAALAANDGPGTMTAMVSLCRLTAIANKSEEAEHCLSLGRGVLERVGAPPDLAAPWREAEGTIAFLGGDLERGLATMKEAVALTEQHRGISSTLASVVHNYGDACRMAERLDEAETTLKRAVALREQILGPGHPDVALSLNSLAIVHIEQKRTDLAVPELERVLEVRKAAFGEQHDHVAGTYNNLGIALRKGDRCGEAMPHLQRAVAMRAASMGEGNVKLMAMRVSIAACALALGQLDEALRIAEQSITALAEPQFAGERCDAIDTAATVYERRGDPAKAAATRALCTVAPK